ncbi:hypothetical protein ACXIT2_22315 [Vibrio parahaemolyticus]
MKTKEERLKELDKILMDNKLGFIYDFLGERDNGLVLPFFARYMDGVIKKGLEFCVTTDRNATAGILYKHNLVFISYGLFDRLCKLSLLIYSSGVLDGKEKPFNFVNLHLVENPFQGFSDEADNFGDKSEVQLLLFVFDSLLGFIVAHEIGHFINKHGDRLDFSGDVRGHKHIERDELIPSHARELVADHYAFRALEFDIENTISSDNPVVSNLLDKFKSQRGMALLSLLFIACYFKLMDGHSPYPHFESTHPEAGVRAHFLFACYLEPYMDTSQQDYMSEVLPLTISMLQEIYEYKGDDFVIDWSEKNSSEEIKQWYLEVYSELHKWSA